MVDYKFPLLAKPSGITLEQHVLDVISEAMLIVIPNRFLQDKYKKFVGKDLLARIVCACRIHDAGKKESRWQSACQKDFEVYFEWKLNNQDKTFEDFAHQFHNIVGKNLRTTGVRHEIISIVNDKTNLPLAIKVAVVSHHSKLSFKFEKRWLTESPELWKFLNIESYKVIENETLEQVAKISYEVNAIRGLLQLSDHRASAREENDFLPSIHTFQYTFPFSSKRNVQKIVEDNWNEDLLLVRAPTGAGKTDSCLLWAKKQIDNNRADRLVIAMPTRFTSNALAINVAENLSSTGLYHSSAWFVKTSDLSFDDYSKRRIMEKEHEFARLLQTPVTVCTIDHLLISLTNSREDHHLINYNLANSCVVIDEADFYDDFTQANILFLLQILRYWKVPVMLMSASLPESAIRQYQSIGYNVDKIIEDKSDYDRERFSVDSIRQYEDLSDIEVLFFKCIEQQNAIIYCNTVDKAYRVYNWFKSNSDADNVILYHSRFTEPDKKKKEEALLDALGVDAWKSGTAHGIAILTQIGEMSINISADIMISDLCPIDRLTQRAGRLCRFDRTKIGILHIVVPYKDGDLYPSPYGSFDRKTKKWTACEAFMKTKEIIGQKVYKNIELVDLINNVYSEDAEYSALAKANAKMLKESFVNNWMILPNALSEIDDDNTLFWKSRNIDNNDTVFVSVPEPKYFKNYYQFQFWKMSNSIDLPIYLIKKLQKDYKLDSIPIRIKDNTETILCLREGFYNSEIGVDFSELETFM